jgi:protein ImuB
MLWLALRFTALPDDPDEKTDALKYLASWAYDHTPYIKGYADDTLLLEVSRCLKLFGGVESLCQRLKTSLDGMFPHYQVGLGHTDKAAWMLSFQQYPISDADSQETFVERLQSVPLEYLVEHPRPVNSLQKMGFACLGDVWQLPLAELGRRFGKAFVTYLQEIQGEKYLPPEIYQAKEHFCRQIAFTSPLRSITHLEIPARQLLQQLIEYLLTQQLQCQQICWRLYSPQGEQQEILIACTRVHSQWEMLFELTRIHLERLSINFEIDRLELECSQTMSVDLNNRQLFQQSREESTCDQVEALVARLQARLGRRAIYQLHLQTEHLPEYSQSLELPFTQMQSVDAAQSSRPCWLLTRPQPLRQRQGRLYWHGQLELVRGPERIQGYWWNRPTARDYFVARREDAVHCWVYQDIAERHWYAQGIFA